MVGDKEWSDITPAQKRGFQAIQYSGYVFHAPSNASCEIRHLSELKNIIRPVE
jgi:FMN phosphatase YigB (HAD superfamily)